MYTEENLDDSGGIMSEPTFYLFSTHQNFQVGKSYLEKGAVYQTHNGWINIALFIALFIFWGAGYFYRITQDEIKLTANVLVCEGNLEHDSYIMTYEFVFENQRYENTELGVSSSLCPRQEIEVFVPPNNPENTKSIISPYLQAYLAIAIVLGLIGLIILIIVFAAFLQNRREHHKYTQLRKADTILKAEIIKIGIIKNDKYSYDFADYRFYGEDGTPIEGQIQSYGNFIWPSQIQLGDTLDILYVDNQNYCVL